MAKVWREVTWYENNRCSAYVFAEEDATDSELLDAAKNETEYCRKWLFDDDMYEIEEFVPGDPESYLASPMTAII